MIKYKITLGNGTMYVDNYNIEVEDWECEQDAVDKLIDDLQLKGCDGCFIQVQSEDENGTVIDTDGNEYCTDEYIIGGNDGLYLYHGGIFNIEKL